MTPTGLFAGHRGPSFEGHVTVDGARLYCRAVGEGPPIVVLHGGPDFDHTYPRSETDRLADAFRLVYYDQRGRGRSFPETCEPGEVGIESEVGFGHRPAASPRIGVRAILGHSGAGFWRWSTRRAVPIASRI